MRVTEAIQQADELRPNTLSDERKAAWVEGLELDVEAMMLDVRGIAEAVRNYQNGIYNDRMIAGLLERGIITRADYYAITGRPTSEIPVEFERAFRYPVEDWDLLLPAPYDEAYVLYLVSKIDYYAQEADNYQNDKAQFSQVWSDTQSWWRSNNRPRSTSGWRV